MDRPLDVIWKAIPDPVDLFASTTPVRDLSCPELLNADERISRYHFSLLTKVGNWIGSLPITLGQLGTLAVLYVRRREQIAVPLFGRTRIAKVWRSAAYLAIVHGFYSNSLGPYFAGHHSHAHSHALRLTRPALKNQD